MTIGGLARAAEVNVETIRYYQRRGLLPQPGRPAGGIRRYGVQEVARLRFVKTAQTLGFSLNEVSELLRLEDGAYCQEASELAEKKLRDVRGKIDRLKRIETVLSELIKRCHAEKGDITCPLIGSLHKGLEQGDI
jgi:MerR family mercuric resistance operon transcriptional regulator